MSHKALLIGLGAFFLFLAGLRLDGLPFIPHTRFSDAAVSHWPGALFIRETIHSGGGFPVWRETIMAGQPFAANALNKTAYPLQWLALLFDPALHLNLLTILHLLLAGVGMWRWLHSLGLRVEARAFGALVYALSPKLVAHLGAGHLDVLYALAWWPWLMWAVSQSFNQPGRTARNTLRTGILAALIFLADVRVGLFALSLAAAREVWEIVQARRWRSISGRLLVLPLFLWLTLSLFIPLTGWRPFLNRDALTPAEAGIFSLEIGQLIGLVLPAHEGTFETLTYLGLPVLLLAAIALLSAPRRHAFWLVVILAAAFYALGENGLLWPALVQIIPALLWFRVPSRAWFVVILAACMLSAYGLQTLLEWRENQHTDQAAASLKRLRLMTVGGMAGTLVCGGFTLLALPLPYSVGLSALVVGGMMSALLLLLLYRRVSSTQAAWLLLMIAFIDLAWTGTRWLEWRGPESWLTDHDDLAAVLVAERADRVYSPTYSLEQQVAAAYDLRLFGGVDPFQLTAVVEAVRQGGGIQGSAGYSVAQPPLVGAENDDLSSANRDAMPDTAILARWHVSHIVAAYPLIHDRLLLLESVNGVYIYQNQDYSPLITDQAMPRWPADWPGLPDKTTVTHLNQITIIAWLVSGIGWILCCGGLILSEHKKGAD